MILVALPLLILVRDIAAYAVDVPLWDQWNFVPLLGRSYERGVSLADLWGQHNEHRLFFPRLIMLALAHASHYNILWELVVILLMAVGIFVLLWHQFCRTAEAYGVTGFPWVIPVFSLLVFSLAQVENWLWGWQIQIFLNVLAVVAGIVLISRRPFGWGRLWGAVGCGIVATYSFANGFAFWVLGVLGIILTAEGRQKKRALGVWAVASVVIATSYLFHFRYTSPSGTPWTHFLHHPGEFVSYLVIYLGRPVINFQGYAMVAGVIGIVLFVSLSLREFLFKRAEFHGVLPFFLLGLYAVCCALLTGIGRVGLGVEQAMSSRYITFSMLIWVAGFTLLVILFHEVRGCVQSRMRRFAALVALGALVFVLVFWTGRTSFRVGHGAFKAYHDRILPARQALVQGGDVELLLRLHVNADHVRRGRRILQKHNLSVFR